MSLTQLQSIRRGFNVCLRSGCVGVFETWSTTSAKGYKDGYIIDDVFIVLGNEEKKDNENTENQSQQRTENDYSNRDM